MKISPTISIIIASLALALEVESRISLARRIEKAVDARERAYCQRLAAKFNETRKLLGMPPTNPSNFAEVLEAYFQSMATVMDQGVTNAIDNRKAKK